MSKFLRVRGLRGQMLALLVILLSLWSLAGCAPAPAATAAAPTQPPATETAPAATAAAAANYKTFRMPGPKDASFELPEGWDFWGNGSWLSPDGGQTLGGLRLVFMKPGQDAGRLLYNEGAVLIDQSPVTVKDVKMTRYKVQSFITNAATGVRVMEGYELIYAMPLEKEELLAGVFIRAASLDQLDKMEPVVQHMAESLKVGAE